MGSEKFLDWLRKTLRKIALLEPYDKKQAEERIKLYLALGSLGYSKEQALAIMDLYMEEEEEA